MKKERSLGRAMPSGCVELPPGVPEPWALGPGPCAPVALGREVSRVEVQGDVERVLTFLRFQPELCHLPV